MNRHTDRNYEVLCKTLKQVKLIEIYNRKQKLWLFNTLYVSPKKISFYFSAYEVFNTFLICSCVTHFRIWVSCEHILITLWVIFRIEEYYDFLLKMGLRRAFYYGYIPSNLWFRSYNFCEHNLKHPTGPNIINPKISLCKRRLKWTFLSPSIFHSDSHFSSFRLHLPRIYFWTPCGTCYIIWEGFSKIVFTISFYKK